MQGFFLSFFMLFAACSPEARAMTYRFAGAAGLMVQPTSNYFHVVRGGYGEMGNATETFLVRAGYAERPPFSAAGFVDQEFFSFAMLGSKVTKAKNHGLFAYVGGGQLHGVLRADDDLTITAETRRYQISGLVTNLEYALRWRKMEVALAHQLFIGKGTKPQTDAYVAWPYAFVYLHLGVGI